MEYVGFQEQIPEPKLYFRIQLENEMEWCTIQPPSSYDSIITAGKYNLSTYADT